MNPLANEKGKCLACKEYSYDKESLTCSNFNCSKNAQKGANLGGELTGGYKVNG